MEIATSFTCFKPNITQENLVFYIFSMVENPAIPRINRLRKNLDELKQNLFI